MAGEPADDCSRRAALRLAFVAPALVPLASLTSLCGCRSQPAEPPGKVVELAVLPEGARVVVLDGDEPIELVRTGTSVRARSLWCTHTGCRVNWDTGRSLYQCLCHDGRFDADGNVIAGPPTRALRTTTLVVEAGRVVIPPRPPAAPAPKGERI